MVVRGRPIARARSMVPVPVRPSATQRVPECVCVKLSVRGAVTAVVSQGSRIFPAIVSRYRKFPRGTDFTGILQRRQDQYIHERMLI